MLLLPLALPDGIPLAQVVKHGQESGQVGALQPSQPPISVSTWEGLCRQAWAKVKPQARTARRNAISTTGCNVSVRFRSGLCRTGESRVVGSIGGEACGRKDRVSVLKWIGSGRGKPASREIPVLAQDFVNQDAFLTSHDRVGRMC